MGDHKNRQTIRIIPPESYRRKEFILYQYYLLDKHRNKQFLPAEYYDQLIGLLEEIEDYEKCAKVQKVVLLRKF